MLHILLGQKLIKWYNNYQISCRVLGYWMVKSKVLNQNLLVISAKEAVFRLSKQAHFYHFDFVQFKHYSNLPSRTSPLLRNLEHEKIFKRTSMLEKKRFWSKWSKSTRIDFETFCWLIQIDSVRFDRFRWKLLVCGTSLWFTVQHMDLL